ncbi:uncharacterized protein BCR38DRAFT_405142 [Pseudomassariella vexata]|uniref:Uncharacterized protein n=1 Tax=Pseudomassariella vexata TaxID=1141098 RepID=A0A1Y2EKR4_9PEZI|nr:uncharacterized protein BCR38DRAFT_405142 [Pseudomassariella vexata]ORY72143.1 hypothetical protein BCR38DRAFT_405142 [Pseudomassariella vexata]
MSSPKHGSPDLVDGKRWFNSLLFVKTRPIALSSLFIYMSANPRNVETISAVADHETFSRGIIEIIGDDSRLVDYLPGLMITARRPGEGRLPWELASTRVPWFLCKNLSQEY